MDQTTTGAAVAVTERMDRLKLGVGDGSLSHSRKVLEIDEADKVIEQI